MPYLIQDPIDGEPTQRQSYRYVPEGDQSLRPGEVSIADADWRDGWVWDAATSSLREPTDADRLRWAKRDKEHEIRDASELEVDTRTRRNEADIVVHKSATGAAMSQAERDIRAVMQANHLKVVDLVGQVRAATTVAQVEAIYWTPPTQSQVQTFSTALAEAEEVIQAARKKRKKPNPIADLTERIEAIEAELDARAKIFES